MAYLLRLAFAAGTLGTVLWGQQPKAVPGSEECAGCHDAGPRTGKREAGMPPPFDAAALRPRRTRRWSAPTATRPRQEGVSARRKARPRGLRHLPPRRADAVRASLHGTAAARGDKLAPRCKDCHGTHDILRPSTPSSPTSTMEIPKLCGGCHREGSPVTLTHNIPQTNILGNYMDSIHGEGLFKTRPDCDGGLHELPHGALRAAAHRPALLHRQGRTSPRPAPSATRRSRPCTAK